MQEESALLVVGHGPDELADGVEVELEDLAGGDQLHRGLAPVEGCRRWWGGGGGAGAGG